MRIEDHLQEIVIDSSSAPKVSLAEEEVDDTNSLTKYLVEGKNFVIMNTHLPAPRRTLARDERLGVLHWATNYRSIVVFCVSFS
mgnify:CR=1 FL=1